MPILQLPTQVPGMVGVFPNQKFMVTTDNLATITTAGYLNAINLQSNPLANTDIIQVLYSYNQQTTVGTYGLFTVAISGVGVITLTNQTVPIANAVLTDVVNTMAAGSSIILAKVDGTEAGNAVTASGVAGLITTSSLTTAGAGNYAITWTNTFITATSVVLLTIAGGTNTTENVTLKVIPGAGTATLTIYNTSAATALNGTIFISYLVM